MSFRPRRGGTIRYDRHDRRAQLALLDARFAGARWHTARLLHAARSASDFSFDSMGQVDLNRWWNGRVTLIGDATSGGYAPRNALTIRLIQASMAWATRWPRIHAEEVQQIHDDRPTVLYRARRSAQL